MTHLSPKMSKRIKQLKLKYCMNWDELDRAKLEASWLYKLVSAFAPVSIGWAILVAVFIVSLWSISK